MVANEIRRSERLSMGVHQAAYSPTTDSWEMEPSRDSLDGSNSGLEDFGQARKTRCLFCWLDISRFISDYLEKDGILR